jgi:hypothetical protein
VEGESIFLKNAQRMRARQKEGGHRHAVMTMPA